MKRLSIVISFLFFICAPAHALPIVHGGTGYINTADSISYGGGDGILFCRGHIDGFNDDELIVFGISPPGTLHSADRWLDLESPDVGTLVSVNFVPTHAKLTAGIGIVAFDYEDLNYNSAGEVSRINGISPSYIELFMYGTYTDSGEFFFKHIIAKDTHEVPEPYLLGTVMLGLFILSLVVISKKKEV